MKHFCPILLVLSAIGCGIVSISAQRTRCSDPSWYLDSTSAKCYKLMEPNPVTLDEAFSNCAHDLMEMVSVTSQAQLQTFSDICRDQLNIAPAVEGPGCWMPYKRFQPAPKDTPNFRQGQIQEDSFKPSGPEHG